MSSILSLGALDKITREYVYPKIANKKDTYICPECEKDLILVQGNIRVHHFRHKVDSLNPCHHYNNPSESMIHKDAKLLIKKLLEMKVKISFIRTCCSCKKDEEYDIPETDKNSEIILEYTFDYKGKKIADVAYLDQKELLCIIEIFKTHRTHNEDRPEPWFEINAVKLLETANDKHLSTIKIPCIRQEKCDTCNEKDKKLELQKIKKEKKEKIKSKPRNIPVSLVLTDAFKKRVYLDVPYSNKDIIKEEYGGKWDNEAKLWYIKRSTFRNHREDIKNIGQEINWNDCVLCCPPGTGYYCGEPCYSCHPDYDWMMDHAWPPEE